MLIKIIKRNISSSYLTKIMDSASWSSFPATQRLYYEDTYKCEGEAKVLAAKIYSDQGDQTLFAVLLDRTIFHPQGGGQPNDAGKMINTKGDSFVVQELKNEDQRILHIGKFDGGTTFQADQEVKMVVDAELRKLHARIHSAGHLLDVGMRRLGFEHKPGKGYHYPKGAYVEYIGKMDQAQRDKVIQQLAKALEGIMEETSQEDKVWSKICEYSEGAEALGGKAPDYIPEGKDFRVVKLMKQDLGCPCGGTHVKHIKEIGPLKISKVQNKGKNVRVSYEVSAP